MWWSTEMHRLTYSEWQAALPRMVRRWNRNRRHQRDDDASSAAAETAQAEAVARCDPEYRDPGTAGSRAKLTHMRTFADCRCDIRYVICILNS